MTGSGTTLKTRAETSRGTGSMSDSPTPPPSNSPAPPARRASARAAKARPRVGWGRLLKYGYNTAAIGLMGLVLLFIVGLLLFSGSVAKRGDDLRRGTAANAGPQPTPTVNRSYVKAQAIEPQRLAELINSGEALVLDTRETGSWMKSHIPGVSSMPHYFLTGQAKDLPKDKLIVTVCSQALCGQGNGEEVARIVINQGLDNVGYLKGNFEAWTAAGLPTEP